MRIAYSGGQAVLQRQGEGAGQIGEILRLLGGGATGAILLALGEGPMQTKVLTHRVSGYTSRTIYRSLPKLTQLGVVERDDEPGGPAKVVNTLTPEAGIELCALVVRFAQASETLLPDGQVESGTWGSLGQLADLWEAGVVDALSRGPRSPTDLVQIQHGLSYHQVSRRAGQFMAAGFLSSTERSARRQRRYALTEKARRTMGLIAAIGQWCRNHGDSDGDGLSVEEVATVLRVSLPLAEIPQHHGKVLEYRVVGAERKTSIWARADDDGRIRSYDAQPAPPDATVVGDLESWLVALVDGKQPIAASDDKALARDCLTSLYEKLWTPRPF